MEDTITITTKLLSGADVNQNNDNAKTQRMIALFAPLRYTLEIFWYVFP